MQLSIIILNWNSKDYLRACLRSVYAHTRDVEFEVVVIDGASYDGCGAMLAQEFPQVRFIQSDQNLGFAKANNVAARQSSGDVLLFLNPDTEVRDNAIGEMYAALKSLPDVGAVGARLLNSDGTLQTSCVQAFPTLTNQLLASDFAYRCFPRCSWWGKRALHESGQAPAPVEGISGACLMTLRQVFEPVGGFSECYFMYYEDMDYCLKVKKAGCGNYVVPQTEVLHHGGKSSGGGQSLTSNTLMAEAGWRYFRNHHGRFTSGLFRAG
ncbi:MAG: glycosyltransferase family 2 protein, partial [Limisphaerales bacterium]